jgi:single-strand DNA-binding protein
MYLNRITLIGFIGSDAERKAANSTNIAIFSLATKTSWKNDAGSWESRTEWHRCVAFGKLADFAGTLSKGAHLSVEGELRSYEYQRELAVGTQKTALTQRVWEVREARSRRQRRNLRRESRGGAPLRGISFSHSTGLSTERLSIGWQQSLCCFFPEMPMVQPAQARRRNYGCFRGRLLFGRSAVGRVFAQAIVNSIFVVIVHVITHEAE